MEKKIVTVRNLPLGDGITKICIPVTARTIAELEEQIGKICAAPCDMIEMRADYFTGNPMDELKVLREQMPQIPLLFTCRTKAEGGMCDISLESYAELNRAAAKSGLADLIDLELNRGEELLQELIPELQHFVRVLVSFHDFEKTPGRDTLIGLLDRMQNLGADITKAAVMPQGERDVLTLLVAAVAMKEQYADRPYIVMSMGKLGSISRLAGSLTGSAVTFASAGAISAPGQLDAEFVEKCRQKI